MMLKEVNLQEKLLKERAKSLKKDEVLVWAQQIFKDLEQARSKTLQKLETSNKEVQNNFNFNKVDADNIFHIHQIKKICIDYRLRFLDTQFFKGDYPEEVISKIHELEKAHNTQLNGFKIIAPSKLFVLKKADDPLLFAPMGNGYYYLVHKWGNDLHPLRKYKVWSFKNVGNLAVLLLTLSFLISFSIKDFVFNQQASGVYALVLFLFIFKFGVGFTLLYGISSGKNFNEYIWQSQYNKVR